MKLVNFAVCGDILTTSVCAIYASLIMHKCAPFSPGVLCPYSLIDFDSVYFFKRRTEVFVISRPMLPCTQRNEATTFPLVLSDVQIKCICAFFSAASGRVSR